MLSKHLLNTDWPGPSATHVGSLFQSDYPPGGEIFLMSSPNLPWCSFVLFHCDLPSVPREQRPAPLPLLSAASWGWEQRGRLRALFSPDYTTQVDFQPFYQLSCPLLDTFKYLTIPSTLWSPELHPVLQVHKFSGRIAPSDRLTMLQEYLPPGLPWHTAGSRWACCYQHP